MRAFEGNYTAGRETGATLWSGNWVEAGWIQPPQLKPVPFQWSFGAVEKLWDEVVGAIQGSSEPERLLPNQRKPLPRHLPPSWPPSWPQRLSF